MLLMATLLARGTMTATILRHGRRTTSHSDQCEPQYQQVLPNHHSASQDIQPELREATVSLRSLNQGVSSEIDFRDVKL